MCGSTRSPTTSPASGFRTRRRRAGVTGRPTCTSSARTSSASTRSTGRPSCSRRASRCPKRVYAHGFLFNRGEKMSKSVGNVVDPFALAAHFGVDPMRYFFLREVPFGQDGSYSHEAIVNRINADLANDLGNLAQRSLSMINKHCGSAVPEPGPFTHGRRGTARRGRWAAGALPGRHGSAGRSTRRCRPSGRWLPTRTAISPGRSPGRCANPIRSGWAPCSTSRRRCCGRSRSWRRR